MSGARVCPPRGRLTGRRYSGPEAIHAKCAHCLCDTGGDQIRCDAPRCPVYTRRPNRRGRHCETHGERHNV